MPLTTLSPHDLQWALKLLPKVVLEVLKDNPGRVFVAGGFIRAAVAREEINDIDIFVSDKETADLVADRFLTARFGYREPEQRRSVRTDNATTILGTTKLPIQIIHRWVFANPEECIASFDFTVAASALFWLDADKHLGTYVGPHGPVAADMKSGGTWASLCDDQFYPDLAAKRLVYRSPAREEEAGGSLLRVLKFYQKGYRIPLSSMGAVISRLLAGLPEVNFEKRTTMDKYAWADQIGHAVTGLLREVDPAIDPSHIAHLPDAS